MRLVQEFGAHTGRQLQFDQDTVGVGRAPDNDVVFDANVDLDASGHHCEFTRELGVWYVSDAGSRNGTWVNGVRVQRQRLSPGDLVECGKGGPRLRVELPGAPPVPAFPPPSAVPGPFAPPGPSAGAFASAVPGPFPPPGGSTVAMPQFVDALKQAGLPPPPTGLPMGLPMNSPGMASPGMGLPLGVQPGMGLGPGQGMGLGPPGGAPLGFPPGPGPSVGQAMAAGMPAGAQVGKRTMALMIDQALLQADKRRGTGTGLKVMVGLLTILVLGSLALGGLLLSEEENGHNGAGVNTGGGTSGNTGGGGLDPANAGARLAAANEAAIYMLAVNDGHRDRGFCTAFAVTHDLLATNAHCVAVARREAAQGGQIVVLRNKSPGTRIAVTDLWADSRFENRQYSTGGSGYDVGLARVGATLPSQVRLAGEVELFALHEGDAIFVYGFPGMTMNEASPVATITLGLINRLTDFFDQVAQPAGAQKLQHSAQTSGGSSGSPIFTPAGSVVGINAGSLADEEHQIVYDPQTHQQHEVEVNRGSNFKYGMRADLIRAAIQTVGEHAP